MKLDHVVRIKIKTNNSIETQIVDLTQPIVDLSNSFFDSLDGI
jgi:hypothetical protein